MGLPEFYNPIKSSVDEIKASTVTIEDLVTQLQQTDVASLSNKVDMLGWFDKYKGAAFGSSNYPNLAYEVIGKGILVGITVNDQSFNNWVSVDIDGTFIRQMLCPPSASQTLLFSFNNYCRVYRSDTNVQIVASFLLAK